MMNHRKLHYARECVRKCVKFLIAGVISFGKRMSISCTFLLLFWLLLCAVVGATDRQTAFPLYNAAAETKTGRCCSSNWCATHFERESYTAASLHICAQGGSKCMCRRPLESNTSVARTFSIPRPVFLWRKWQPGALMCDQVSNSHSEESRRLPRSQMWGWAAGRNIEKMVKRVGWAANDLVPLCWRQSFKFNCLLQTWTQKRFNSCHIFW
jgi:hypothetical protein